MGCYCAESLSRGVLGRRKVLGGKDSTGRSSTAWGGEPSSPSGRAELGEVKSVLLNIVLMMVAIGLRCRILEGNLRATTREQPEENGGGTRLPGECLVADFLLEKLRRRGMKKVVLNPRLLATMEKK